MTYRYDITLKHHFKNAWGILIFIIGFSLGPYYLKYRHGEEYDDSYNIVFFAAFLLFFIPQLIVHLRFYWMDKGRTLYYTPTQQQISLVINNDCIIDFSFDEIALIERNKSIPFAENRMLWLPWDSYNYSVIHLTNGQRFVVTSLLVTNMDLPLEESKIKLRKRFYCYPFGVKENIKPASGDRN